MAASWPSYPQGQLTEGDGGLVSLCWALTIVLCLPDSIRHSPQAREDEEDRQLVGVWVPQQEDHDAREVNGSSWSEETRRSIDWLFLLPEMDPGEPALGPPIRTHEFSVFLTLSSNAQIHAMLRSRMMRKSSGV